MGSSYPGGLDSFPTNRTNTTPNEDTQDLDHNNYADALNKVEATLGVNPQGSFDTVADRLANGGSVPNSVIQVALITAGTTSGSQPSSLFPTPDGQTMFVAIGADNTVVPVNIATLEVGTPIAVGSDPSALIITPDGTKLFVANYGDGTVSVIDVQTLTVVHTTAALVDGAEPSAFAMSPDGTKVYCADGLTSIFPINTSSYAVGSAISLGAGTEPSGLVITPDGTKLYASCFGTNKVFPVTLPSTVGAAITVGDSPYGIDITPDGATVYVANNGDTTVTPITVANNTPGAPIVVGFEPGGEGDGVAVSPDGKTVWVPIYTTPGAIVPIDVATNVAGTPIDSVGSQPCCVKFSPNGASLWVNNFGDGTTSVITRQLALS